MQVKRIEFPCKHCPPKNELRTLDDKFQSKICDTCMEVVEYTKVEEEEKKKKSSTKKKKKGGDQFKLDF